eukprot:13520050-Heterocapsa_arctica.AAC.1
MRGRIRWSDPTSRSSSRAATAMQSYSRWTSRSTICSPRSIITSTAYCRTNLSKVWPVLRPCDPTDPAGLA